MNLSEAKQNAKDFRDTLVALIAATETVKDSDFAAMQQRKESLEAEIDKQRERLKEVSAKVEEEIEAKKKAAAAEIAEFKQQLKNAENAVDAARTEARITRDTMREAIAGEKAALLLDKQTAVARLDDQIAARQRSLNDLNAALDGVRAQIR